jgi:hypothetical protein
MYLIMSCISRGLCLPISLIKSYLHFGQLFYCYSGVSLEIFSLEGSSHVCVK